MMDANEAHARQLNARARQEAATAFPTDAASQKIIREAQEACRREKERQFMEQAEIFELLGVHTTEDPIFTTLQTLGFTQMGVQVIPGSRWRGTQDKGEIVFERHAWDRLMERFDTIAQRLGYVKKTRNR